MPVEQTPAGPPAWTYWLAALTAALFSAYLKIGLSQAMPTFDARDDTACFHVEGALQYRYAKLLAAGQDIPDVDVKAQYPEGLRVGRDVSLIMERATAWTFWLLGGTSVREFHRFVVAWVAGFSSLSVLALFALGLALGAPPGLSLACAAAYAVAWAQVSPMAATYGLQTFALPLLFWTVAALAFALREDSPGADAAAAGAAAALALALASWHFSRFFLLTLWPALSFAAWRARQDDGARRRLLRAVLWLLAGAAAAGLASGVLRQTDFLLSPEMWAGAALAAWLAFGPRGLAFGALAAAAAAAWSRGAESAAYGHVWGLLWDKLRLGLVKPEDPRLLSQDARLLWTGPFNSPDAGFLFFSLFPLALLALPRLWPSRQPEAPEDAAGDLCDALLLIELASTALVLRLTDVLVFFLAAAPLRRRASRWRPRAVLALAAAVAACEGLKTVAPQSRLNPFMRVAAALTPPDRQPGYSGQNERRLLAWLSRDGGGRPVLADFGLSASILAYTPSPVLLQPKFESGPLREKTAAYLHALYSGEDDFDAYCRRYGAKLFVYSAADLLDQTRDGPRYMAAAPPLRDSTAAVLFHFHPEALRHFRLVYENADYRVYEEGEPGIAPKAVPPIYDPAQYHPQHAADGTLVLDVTGVLQRRDFARAALFLAAAFARMGQEGLARRYAAAARAAWPGN